jgi:long-chain fatty acid transport protein
VRSSVALLLLLFAPVAQASTLEMFGFGGRSPALGATGVATAEDFDCVYLNPAGLADLRRKRLSLGTLVGAFDLNGVDRDVDPALGVVIGGALPIPLGGAMRGRVGLGLGFYVPTTVLNRARAPMPGDPFFALLESRSQVVGIQVAAGARVSERLSLGVGLLALAALRGAIHVSTDAAGRFTTTSEQQLVSHFTPIAGARWRVSPALGLGLTFRGVSQSAYDIRVTNELGEAIPVTLPELRLAGVSQYDPMMLAAEAALRRGRLLIAGQLAWERWSAYPLPTENPVESMPPQEPARFEDTLVPRVGVEWHAAPWRLRGGAFYAHSPAPEMRGMQALLDNHRIALSAGAGLDLPRARVRVPIHVDLWFQAHALLPRDHERPAGRLHTSGVLLVGGLVLGVDL